MIQSTTTNQLKRKIEINNIKKAHIYDGVAFNEILILGKK